MLKIKSSNRFKKDYRKVMKSGKDMNLLYRVIDMLSKEIPLPPKYCDHPLKNNWKGFRDCHIQPDWILIYRINNKELILELTRTGSHSDLGF